MTYCLREFGLTIGKVSEILYIKVFKDFSLRLHSVERMEGDCYKSL